MTGQLTLPLSGKSSGRLHYIRNPTIEIVPPAKSEIEKDKNYQPLDGFLDIIHRVDRVKRLELMYFHNDEQRLLITPQIKTEQSANQLSLTDSKYTSSEGTIHSDVLHRVGQLLVDKLPAEYGVLGAKASLLPLGITPVRTLRVLLPQDQDNIDKSVIRGSPIVATINELVRHNIPYVLQTLLSTRELASVRIAMFDRKHSALTDECFEWLYRDRESPIARIWHRAGFKTNLDLPIGDYWKDGYRSLKIRTPNYGRPSHSKRMREAYVGSAEYAELLRGRLASLQAYQYPKKNYHGKIPFGTEHLELFAALKPNYQSVDWSSSPGRGPPKIIRQDPFSEPAGREIESSGGSPTNAAEKPQMPTAGNADHETEILRFVKILREHGYAAWKIEQDSTSLPDGALAFGDVPSAKLDALDTPTQRLHTLELESQTKSKPTRILQNKERAAYWGLPTITLSTGDALQSEHASNETIADILTAPYREKIEGTGVRTYNIDGDIQSPDGGVVVLPEDVTETCWHLTTDGRLKLMCHGECVAAGPADVDVGTFDFDLPKLSMVDGEKYITDPDGGIMDRGNSIHDRWRKASPPHVPFHHHYVHGTRLINTSGRPFSEIPLPLHDPSELSVEKESDVLRKILKLYLDTAIVEKEGEEIYRGQIQNEVMSMIARLSSPLFPEVDWPSVKTSTNTWFGRAFPNSEDSAESLAKRTNANDVDVIEVTEGYQNGERVKRVQDRAFIYPSGIISPHTSCEDNHRRSVLSDTYREI